MNHERSRENSAQDFGKIEAEVLLREHQIPKTEIRENGEKLSSLKDIDGVRLASSDREYIAREQVVDKIRHVAETIKKFGLGLFVSDAYRSLGRQKEYWENGMENVKADHPEITDVEELRSIVSKFVAPPETAQHCTGGSVDVSLFDLASGELLDFGQGETDKYSEVSYTDNSNIIDEARKNRNLLRSAMETEDFVNYPLEWWHYSFGNQEWAVYKDNEFALYGPLDQD